MKQDFLIDEKTYRKKLNSFSVVEKLDNLPIFQFFLSVAILSGVVSDEVDTAIEGVKQAIKKKCEINAEPKAFDELMVNNIFYKIEFL